MSDTVEITVALHQRTHRAALVSKTGAQVLADQVAARGKAEGYADQLERELREAQTVEERAAVWARAAKVRARLAELLPARLAKIADLFNASGDD